MRSVFNWRWCCKPQPEHHLLLNLKGNKVEIQLTTSEILQASFIGCMRQSQNLEANRRPAHGAGNLNDWQKHISGALGECALAKYLGVYWSGVGKLRGHDVGEMVDVRTQPPKYSYPNSLILHKGDPDDRVFFLVVGLNGRYTIKGWMLAKDGKDEKYWSDPTNEDRYAYFIPESELRSLDEYHEKHQRRY
jgi:hypothetical protein